MGTRYSQEAWLPQGEFKKLKFLPLPLMNAAKDHFMDSFLQKLTDHRYYRKVTSEAKVVDKDNKKLLVAAKVRSTMFV